MINVQDAARLAALYTSQPETSEQSARRESLIAELELKLGIRQVEQSALVTHGDLDDLQGFNKSTSR